MSEMTGNAQKPNASGSPSSEVEEAPTSNFQPGSSMSAALPRAETSEPSPATTETAHASTGVTAAANKRNTSTAARTAEEIEVASILIEMASGQHDQAQGTDPSAPDEGEDPGDDDSGSSYHGNDDSVSKEVSGSDEISEDGSDAPSSPDGSAWSYPGTDGTNWNPIIPRTSWAVPVGNHPYAGSPALITPRPEGASTTLDQQNYRVLALRNMLGEPSGVTVDELRAALEGTRWDMGSALRFINHRFNEARRRERADQPGRDTSQIERDRLIGADSLHHNRRRTIDALYQRLVSAQPIVRPQLTALNVGVLLADSIFDLDEAVRIFQERQVHPQQFQAADRILRHLRIPGPNQVHQDERVALFMTIAGIDDYYAARVLFETHNWDMGRVMDQWMQHGLRSAPNATAASVRRRATYQEPTLAHDDTENLWAVGRPFGVQAPAPDAQDLLDAAEDYGQGTYTRRNGWFINFRRDPAVRVGIMNPLRLGVLWIRKGVIKLTWYGDRAPVEDPRRPGQPLKKGGTEPFDWNNPFHVGDLGGKAISQWFRRGPGTSTKAKGDSYQDDENEWLWNWHNERLFEFMDAHPALWNSLLHPGTAGTWNGTWNEVHDQEWGRTVPYPLQRLARDFNHRFTTQIHLPGMNGQPRQARTQIALNMQRRRVQAICDDFGFDPSPAHPKIGSPKDDDGDGSQDDSAGEGPSGTNAKKGTAAKRKDRAEEDSGDDDASQEDHHDDGSSPPPAKKAKRHASGGKEN